ncbi:hypothetical protein BpHYR1_008830 [Brachionus plicatilis]|uniref:Uncharacterized protein n=1 Tax=Brachionus plicatilis TaxID=10195 RepID=A0A3M7R6P8_BRAPC|nr:hypothetical protein BpHYR1_008830 [Brachionus plicatilis]
MESNLNKKIADAFEINLQKIFNWVPFIDLFPQCYHNLTKYNHSRSNISLYSINISWHQEKRMLKIIHNFQFKTTYQEIEMKQNLLRISLKNLI